MEFLEILFFVSVWQRFAWTGHKLFFSCLRHMIFGYANRKKTKDTPLKTTRESSYEWICQMWEVITITPHWEHWTGLESCPWTTVRWPTGQRERDTRLLNTTEFTGTVSDHKQPLQAYSETCFSRPESSPREVIGAHLPHQCIRLA